MPYDNRNGYNGNRNNGYSGYANNRNGNTNRPATTVRTIQPESVPVDFVDVAEKVIGELAAANEGRLIISTSKIRNILSLASDIYNEEKLRSGAELSPDSVGKVAMMRVRVAYEYGRDDTSKKFIEKAKLLEYLKHIGTDREEFLRFAHYMEALVAYHKYYGGKE